jgi:hypothetical protein
MYYKTMFYRMLKEMSQEETSKKLSVIQAKLNLNSNSNRIDLVLAIVALCSCRLRMHAYA